MKSEKLCSYVEAATGDVIRVPIHDRQFVLYKTLEFNKMYRNNEWISFDQLVNDVNENTSGFYKDESKHTHDISAVLRKDIHDINEDSEFEELAVVKNNACRLATKEDYINERVRLIVIIHNARQKLDNIDAKAQRNGQVKDIAADELEYWSTF